MDSTNTISEIGNSFSSQSNHSQSRLVENQLNSTPTPTLPIIIRNDNQYEEEFPGFKITRETLANLVEANDIDYLRESGGIRGLVAALETNIDDGISGDARDLCRRRKAFGINQIVNEQSEEEGQHQKKKLAADISLRTLSIGLLYGLALNSFKDTTVVLLLFCTALSLAIEIKRNGLQEGALDGVMMLLAIFIPINFSLACSFCKAIYRRLMIMKKSTRKYQNIVVVIRHAEMQQIPVFEIVVGDILCLKPGDHVPADGLFINGYSFKLNVQDGSANYYEHPFVFYGAKVAGGVCQMLVTSVGENTERSRLMRSTSCCLRKKESKLQISMDVINSRLEKIWLSLTVVLLLVQVVRCFVGESECDESHNPDPQGVKNAVEEIMTDATKIMTKKLGLPVNKLVATIGILVLSLRDGVPLGIFVSLAHASKKMATFYGAVTRNLATCAIIGSTTTICINKTGGLTFRPVDMAEWWLGLNKIVDVSKEIPHQVLDTLRDGVGMNIVVSDNKWMTLEDLSLSLWAKQTLGVNIREGHDIQNNAILGYTEVAFDHERNLRGFSLKKKGEEVGNIVHVHWKGDPEKVLSMCSHFYHIDGTVHNLDEQTRAAFKRTIGDNLSSDQSIQCLAFAYKEVIVIDEKEKSLEIEEEEIRLEPIQHGLSLLGFLWLKNPYTPEVREAIKSCQDFGVKIKLIVGDDVNTAMFMGISSGMLKQEETMDEIVLTESSKFRSGSKVDQMTMVDKINIIANCSPSDKLLVVQRLRQKGAVVAVIGASSRDSASLKDANVGILLNEKYNNETTVVGDGGGGDDHHDILVPRDLSFVMLLSMLKLGRRVCNNLGKFMQLYMTINISAFAVNFLAVLISSSEVPIGPFELLWVNMVMDIFGALALAELGDFRNFGAERETTIISKSMWRNISLQSLYQVIVLLIINFKGEVMVQGDDQKVVKTMIFNCFMLCQVFVLINAREREKPNVFQGMLRNNDQKCCLFLVHVAAIVILQVAAAEISPAFIDFERLNLKQWCICVGLAAFSLPIGWVAKRVENVSS